MTFLDRTRPGLRRSGLRRSGVAARAAVLAGAAALVSACSGNNNVQQGTVLTDREAQQGSRLDTPSTIGDLLEFNREGGPSGQNLPVNRYLWRASLDTLNFLPLASTDPFSGVIATDWAAADGSTEERYKVTVYISEPTLEATALQVAVFREAMDENGAWRPAEVSSATPRRLEDAILTRARQLRVAELSEQS
ncbi:MAG: DUF3576 domain-containing protein [Pseudomonadota bacterium]